MTAERIRAADVARMTGLSLRLVQRLAAEGRIPGAARFGSGARRVWTFRLDAIRAWIARREAEAAWRAISTDDEARTAGSPRPGGGGLRSPAASIAEAYERAIGARPSGGSRYGAGS